MNVSATAPANASPANGRARQTHNRSRRPLNALAAAICLVAALVLVPAPGHAAGLLIADGGFGGVLEIVEHDVKVTINNGVVVTEVTQIFRNTEDRQVEALYTFPVPKGASVSNFSMWINGKEMIGEVLEKERAREIYNSYKQQRRDPGLLEQVDYKTFEMRIFPIGPRAEQRVQIAYYQELEFDHDWATYVYPLATVSRPGVQSKTTGKLALTLDARSAVPITALEIPSHKDLFVVTSFNDNYHLASLETKAGSLSRDFVLAYHLARPKTGADLIYSKTRGEDGYFLMTLTAGQELAKLNPGMDYVFVLDISGSMAQQQKLQTSQDSIGAFVRSLSPEDRLEVITFNAQPKTLFNQLTAVSDESKGRAMTFLESQNARGGTRLEPALQTAYKYTDPDRSLN
ncbi:VIT domain-containing protein, partial [Candidatus Sumerlaeota bacterium]